MTADVCPRCERELPARALWEVDPVAPTRQSISRFGPFILHVSSSGSVARWEVDVATGGLRSRGHVETEHGEFGGSTLVELAELRAEEAARHICHGEHLPE